MALVVRSDKPFALRRATLGGKTLLSVHRSGSPTPFVDPPSPVPPPGAPRQFGQSLDILREVRTVLTAVRHHHALNQPRASTEAAQKLLFTLLRSESREIERLTWKAIARYDLRQPVGSLTPRLESSAFFETEGLAALCGRTITHVVLPAHPWPDPVGLEEHENGARVIRLDADTVGQPGIVGMEGPEGVRLGVPDLRPLGQGASAKIFMSTGHYDGRYLAVFHMEEFQVVRFDEVGQAPLSAEWIPVAGACSAHQDCLEHPELGRACGMRAGTGSTGCPGTGTLPP